MKAVPTCHGPAHRPPWRGGDSRLPHFGIGPRLPLGRSVGGRAYSRASCRNRVRNSMRGEPSSGQDQRPDHAAQGEAAVEDGQVTAR